jgi:hypothetical protein
MVGHELLPQGRNRVATIKGRKNVSFFPPCLYLRKHHTVIFVRYKPGGDANVGVDVWCPDTKVPAPYEDSLGFMEECTGIGQVLNHGITDDHVHGPVAKGPWATRCQGTKFIDARIRPPNLVYVYTDNPRDLALQTTKIPPKNYRIVSMCTTATTKINDDKRLLEQSIHSGIESNSPINVRKTAKL